jgi:hypothetical protein
MQLGYYKNTFSMQMIYRKIRRFLISISPRKLTAPMLWADNANSLDCPFELPWAHRILWLNPQSEHVSSVLIPAV